MPAQLFDFPILTPITAKAMKKPEATYTLEFDTMVWGPFPRKLNCSKFMAFKAWQKLSSEDQATVIAAIPIFARQCAGKDEQYICHAATWINQRRFETVTVPTSKQLAPPPPINWEQYLKIYHATGRWNSQLGGEPGTKDYRGPKL